GRRLARADRALLPARHRRLLDPARAARADRVRAARPRPRPAPLPARPRQLPPPADLPGAARGAARARAVPLRPAGGRGARARQRRDGPRLPGRAVRAGLGPLARVPPPPGALALAPGELVRARAPA